MKVVNWVGGICTILLLIISLIEKDYTESCGWGCILMYYLRDMIKK